MRCKFSLCVGWSRGPSRKCLKTKNAGEAICSRPFVQCNESLKMRPWKRGPKYPISFFLPIQTATCCLEDYEQADIVHTG